MKHVVDRFIILYPYFEDKEGHQDICLETELIESPSDLLFSTQQEDVPTIIQNDSGKSTKFPQEENDQCQQRGIVRNDTLRGHVERSYESVDRKQSCDDRIVEVEKKEERCSSWWKDGGQTILHFFAKILGKRAGMDAKGPADRVSPISKHVKHVSRGDKNHNKHRRGIDGGIRLKRVNNGYIVPNHVYRYRPYRVYNNVLYCLVTCDNNISERIYNLVSLKESLTLNAEIGCTLIFWFY